MNATIDTSKGTFTGRTIDSIVRREFGRTAEVRVSADPNSPTYGMAVKAARHGGYDVLATIYSAQEGSAAVDYMIDVYDEDSDGLVAVDARNLPPATLRALRSEAGAAGDFDAVAMINTLLGA